MARNKAGSPAALPQPEKMTMATNTLRLRVVGRMQTPMNSMGATPGSTAPMDDTCTCILVESIDAAGKVIPVRMQQNMGGNPNVLMIPSGSYLDEATLPKGTVFDLVAEA